MGSKGSRLAKVTLLCLSSFLGVHWARSGEEESGPGTVTWSHCHSVTRYHSHSVTLVSHLVWTVAAGWRPRMGGSRETLSTGSGTATSRSVALLTRSTFSRSSNLSKDSAHTTTTHHHNNFPVGSGHHILLTRSGQCPGTGVLVDITTARHKYTEFVCQNKVLASLSN